MRQESGDEDNRNEPRDPRDPDQRGDAEPDDAAAAGEDARSNMPAWLVGLPSQIRDAFVNEDFDAIPPRYRKFVQGYLLWLLEEERKQSER